MQNGPWSYGLAILSKEEITESTREIKIPDLAAKNAARLGAPVWYCLALARRYSAAGLKL
jgi:hypothetical protein